MEKKEETLIVPLDNLDLIAEESPETDKVEDNTQTNDQELEEEKKEEKAPEMTTKEKRHAEQEAGRVAEVMRLRTMVIDTEVEKATNDARSLLELSKKDPKLADEVARKFWFDDFKDAKSSIVWEQIEQKTWTDDDKEAYYQQRKAKEDHELAKTEAQSLLEKLPADVQEEAIDEFNELIEGKTLTREKAIKIANMITLSLGKGKPKADVTEWLKKLNSTGISNSKKPDDEWTEKLVIVNGRMVLLNSKQTK